MKTKGILTLAALATLAFAGTSHAQTVVRITGSTAYRGQVHAAIAHLLGASGAAPYTLTGGATYGYSGNSGVGGASQTIWVATIRRVSAIVKTSWSGSVGGVQTVSNSLNVSFIDSATSGLAAGGTPNLTASVSEIPDVAMSDTFQSSTPFTANELQEAPSSPVGVVPFVWVASYNAPSGLANVTPQLAQAVFFNGSASLALFTGSSSDESTNVFAIGRDPDSGTRLTAFAETKVGVNSTVNQYQPTTSGTAVTSQALWPASTVNGIDLGVGNGGYASGGTLATQLRYDTSAISGYYITYLSTGDAGTATSGSGAGAGAGKQLTYNGVTYSTTAVKNGSYTFWGYEHLLYRQDIDSNVKIVADAIAAQIHDTDAVILINDMRVSRPTDGGIVSQNY